MQTPTSTSFALLLLFALRVDRTYNLAQLSPSLSDMEMISGK